MDKIVMYRGRRIDKMSREELIEALNIAVRQIELLAKQKQHERDTLLGLTHEAGDCPSCHGTGRKEVFGEHLTCLNCDGTGASKRN